MPLGKTVTLVLFFVIDTGRLGETNSRIGCGPDGEN